MILDGPDRDRVPCRGATLTTKTKQTMEKKSLSQARKDDWIKRKSLPVKLNLNLIEEKQELAANIIRDRAQGLSVQNLADKYSLARTSIYRCLKNQWNLDSITRGRPTSLDRVAESHLVNVLRERHVTARELKTMAQDLALTRQVQRGIDMPSVAPSMGGQALRRGLKRRHHLSLKEPIKQHVARYAASTRANVQTHLAKLQSILMRYRDSTDDPEMIRADRLLFMDEVSFGGEEGERSNKKVFGVHATYATTVLSGRHVTSATTYSAAGDYIAHTLVLSGAATLLPRDTRLPMLKLDATNVIINEKGSMKGQDADGTDGAYMGWAKHLVQRINIKYGVDHPVLLLVVMAHRSMIVTR
jgi:hypothetical protein